MRRLLQGRGYTIIGIVQEKGFFQNLALGKVSAKDRSVMYKELATMLKAGVSITQAIEIVAETPNKKLQKVLREVSTSLENGFPLSVAMSGHPKIFPIVETGVVRAGEATGNLVKVLQELAITTERSANFSGKVKGAMIYPAFIVVVMIVVGAIILTKVIPPIKDIFSTQGAELPLSTRMLIAMAEGLINYWGWIILAVILFVVIIKLFLITKPGKRTSSVLALNFPVFGTLMRQVYLAQFNRTMTLLVGAGVPIIEAVEIVTDSTTNVIFRDALTGLMHSLEQGSPISVSLQGSKYFPKLMTQLLFVGQQSGDLGGTTQTLAEYFEGEVDV
ncbi:hypothetical protein A3F39_03055, partial [Candidatus Berkelbacteria bacterium RIFCSPHIGHO2_12_FULL_50_11]